VAAPSPVPESAAHGELSELDIQRAAAGIL
jgi:hypothetical protein